MKKIVLMALLALGLGVEAQAQTAAGETTVQQVSKVNYEGKWKMKVADTPMGDVESLVQITRNEEGKLVFAATLDQVTVDQVSVEEHEERLVVSMYISSMGMDIQMDLKVVDETHLKGTMMDMFDVTMEKVVE